MHPYATTPKEALGAVRDTRRIMGQFKDKKAELWITEIGWATGGDRTAFTVSPGRQAAYLRRSYGLLAKNRGRMRITDVIWYSWRDLPGGIRINHTGLFTAGFTRSLVERIRRPDRRLGEGADLQRVADSTAIETRAYRRGPSAESPLTADPGKMLGVGRRNAAANG